MEREKVPLALAQVVREGVSVAVAQAVPVALCSAGVGVADAQALALALPHRLTVGVPEGV